MIKLLWGNIVRRRGQTIFTVTITSITMFIFVLLFSVFFLLKQGLTLSEERLGADILVQASSISDDGTEMIFSGKPINVYIPKEIASEIKGIDGVEKVTTQFFAHTLAEECCSTGKEIRIVGYDEDSDFIIKSWLEEKNISKLSDDEVVIGSNVQSALGDKMRVVTKVYSVSGSLFETGTGVDETIYMNMSEARKIAGSMYDLKYLWEDKNPEDVISSVLIKTNEDADKEKIAEIINNKSIGVKAIVTSSTINRFRNMINAIKNIILGMWFAFFICVSLCLFSRFAGLVKERKREIGLLRSLGITKFSIFLNILLEIIITAEAGGIIGSIFGAILTPFATNKLTEMLALPIASYNYKFVFVSIAVGLFVSAILGICASVFPAIRCASLEPQEAISRAELD